MTDNTFTFDTLAKLNPAGREPRRLNRAGGTYRLQHRRAANGLYSRQGHWCDVPDVPAFDTLAQAATYLDQEEAHA